MSKYAIIDSFFYNSYTFTYNVDTQYMFDIYVGELNFLLYSLSKHNNYYQEFARDYRAYALLNTSYKKDENDILSIVIKDDNVYFFKGKNELCFISLKEFYESLSYYYLILKEKIIKNNLYINNRDQVFQNIENKLESFFTLRIKNKSILTKLSFWKNSLLVDEIKAYCDRNLLNAFKSYKNEKSLTLYKEDLRSIKQLLESKDTLTSLIIRGADVDSLDLLSQFVHLKTLYLTAMNIDDISFLENLNIKELGLANNKISDISVLSTLKNLDHLYIPLNPIKSFTPLNSLNKLRNLYVDDTQMYDKSCYAQIKEDLNLYVLHMTLIKPYEFSVNVVYESKGHIKKRQKEIAASPLKESNKNTLLIKDRWLYSAILNSLGHVPCVKYDLEKLKKLYINDEIELCPDHTFLNEYGDYSALSSAIKLKELTINNKSVNDFSFLKYNTNLLKLNLAHTDFKDLNLLKGLNKLTYLNLSNTKIDFKDFNLPKNLSKLTYLNLNNSNIECLDSILYFTNLKELHLNDCDNLNEKSFYVLENLSKLEKIFVNNKSFSTYSFKYLERLERLKYISLDPLLLNEIDFNEIALKALLHSNLSYINLENNPMFIALINRAMHKLSKLNFEVIKCNNTCSLPYDYIKNKINLNMSPLFNAIFKQIDYAAHKSLSLFLITEKTAYANGSTLPNIKVILDIDLKIKELMKVYKCEREDDLFYEIDFYSLFKNKDELFYFFKVPLFVFVDDQNKYHYLCVDIANNMYLKSDEIQKDLNLNLIDFLFDIDNKLLEIFPHFNKDL